MELVPTEDDVRYFTKYTSMPTFQSPVEGQLSYAMWLSETKWFIKDMRELLLLKHDRFWHTFMNNEMAMESVLSFMQNAIPMYLTYKLNSLENKEIAKLYSLAHKTVYQIICRLTTPQKNRHDSMDRQLFANMIYDHFTVSMPLIFDFIFIYGRGNEKVSSIVESIVKLQPKYEVDLKMGLQYLINVFASIQARCESEIRNQNLSESVLIDLVLYALDCSYNLGSLVGVSAVMRNMCCDVSMEYPISNFYENVVVALYACIQSENENSEYLTRLNDSRIELLHAFRSIIHVHLDKILQDPENSLLSADKFLGILTECLANNVFVNDYKNQYPIDVDFEILEQAYSSVDKIELDFIRNAYTASTDEEGNGQKNNRRSQPLEKAIHTSDSNETQNCRNEAEKAHEVQSSVQYVLDILPHLDPDYVRGVIEHFDCVEKALAVLLEGNEDTQLINDSKKDTNGEIVPEDPLDSFYLQTGIDRLNIYDGDEFDVMSKSNVKGTIKKGKGMPGNPKSFRELMDDKRHVNEMRHVYSQYSTLVDMDDDEYDDTFEAMAESESRHIKLAKGAKNLVIEESDNDDEADTEDSETESEPNKRAGFDFCENPEIARKRYEERLNSKGVKAHAPREAADVRGNPKGQGQDSKVLQNRKNKNEHKASQGNHNRKRGATFKRSRGMVPS
ncbi:activating signal cointegrator 1 complex subunit 2 isoform X2 [Anopheles aquasalis]|uniref:activating signal cointegrator 1 complex subunit 2 isoform X2 n=1 Tax=Anopheles aquasalis TaxID=42839 RepID=UPI00215AD2CD|nr:activating signal cointegrator 1 complex subunit 2 isoform X2 [Anopheles aquasalis]